MNADQFYKTYIIRSEEMRAAIQRKDWTDVEQFIRWREEQLARMQGIIVNDTDHVSLHKEWLNKIMVLDCENISSLTAMMESLKRSIQESRKQERLLQYAHNA